MTSLCGKVTQCLFLSVSDLRDVRSGCGHRPKVTSKRSRELSQFSRAASCTFKPARFSEDRCTNTAATQWFHETGRHEGSLSEIGAEQEGNGTHPWI